MWYYLLIIIAVTIFVSLVYGTITGVYSYLTRDYYEKDAPIIRFITQSIIATFVAYVKKWGILLVIAILVVIIDLFFGK